MVMDTACVKMRRNNTLEPVAPKFSGQFHSNGMSFIRCDLALPKALVSMQGDDASGLAETDLGRVKLIPGEVNIAVDAGRIEKPVRLIFVGSLCDHIRQRLLLFFCEFLLCLLRVRHV